MLESLDITDFKGLRTGIANPEPNTAKSIANMLRHKKRGELWEGLGYAKKFTSLPGIDAIRVNTAPARENIHNFYCPEYGGKNITVLSQTYTKSGYQTTPDSYTRCGIFIRPYWGSRMLKGNFPDGRSIDFEQGVGDWVDSGGNHTIARSSTDKYSGLYSGKIVATGVGDATSNYVTLPNTCFSIVPGERYKLTFYVRESDKIRINYSVGGQTGHTDDVSKIAGIFTKIEFEFTALNTNALKIWLDSAVDAYIDNVIISGWVDDWRELNEVMLFEIVDLGTVASVNRLYIDDSAVYDFATVDPNGTVFNSSYFTNWTVVYSEYGDDENYDIVRHAGYDDTSTYFYLDIDHPNTDFASRVVGTKIRVYRNFMMEDTPTSVTSHIQSLLSEIRLTTGGNLATDISVMAGFRKKTFASAAAGMFSKNIDELIADTAVQDVWTYAAPLAYVGLTANALGVPPATYELKSTIVMDDGQETELRDAYSEAAGPTLNTFASIVVAAASFIQVRAYRSKGALPRKAKYLRVYMSDDAGASYFRVKDIDLTDPQNFDELTTVTDVLGLLDHLYDRGAVVGSILISGSDWANAGAEAPTQLGRDIADKGIMQYKTSTVVGQKQAIGNVLVGTSLQANKVFISAVNGDGAAEWDVFPNDGAHTIDIEYNDGDAIVALGPLGERIMALKQRSLVLITQRNDGGYDRELITRADGICSQRTLNYFDDTLYWAGYNGVYRFSTRTGWKLFNPWWLQDWKDLTDAQKEAAAGIVDRKERQYRLAANGQEWVIDLDDEEAMMADLADQPACYAVQPKTGKVDFLSGALIQTLGDGTRHDGANYTASYESSKITRLSPGEIAQLDLLVMGFSLLYESSVTLSLALYLDDDTSALYTFGSSEGLIAGNKKVTVYLAVDKQSRCKYFRWKLSGTTTADSQKIRLKHIQPIVGKVPAFGDILVNTL